MAYQSLMDLMNADAMKQAQLYGMGQEAKLRNLQMSQAEQGAQDQAQLRSVLPQLMQSGDPQGMLKNLMASGNPGAIELAGKVAPVLAAMQKDTKTTWQDVGDKLAQFDAYGQPTGMTMPKGAAPKEVSRWSEPFGMGGATVQKNLDTGEVRTAVSRPPVTNVNIDSPKQIFKNERDLRNDFQGLPTTKGFREVQTAFDQINYALSNPSAASDLAAATKFMKLLDPGSVVRESELGMAMAATGKLDQLANYYNRLQTGEKLTPSQRKDFKTLAKGLYDAAAGRYNETASEYQNLAQQYELNPERIAKKVSIAGPAKPRDITPAKNFLNAATTQDDLSKRVKSLKNKGWSDEEIKQAYGE